MANAGDAASAAAAKRLHFKLNMPLSILDMYGVLAHEPYAIANTSVLLPRRLGLRGASQPGGHHRFQLLPRHSWWAFLANGLAWHLGQGG